MRKDADTGELETWEQRRQTGLLEGKTKEKKNVWAEVWTMGRGKERTLRKMHEESLRERSGGQGEKVCKREGKGEEERWSWGRRGPLGSK